MSVDATLTVAERNAVFKWLTDRQFNPGDFEWSEAEQPEHYRRNHDEHFKVSVLTHRRTKYFFIFGSGIYVIYSPSTDRKPNVQEHMNDWMLRHECFNVWLNRLEYEIDAPDLWASIGQGQEKALPTAAASRNLDNRPFTDAEQSLIATKLDEIKRSLLEGQQFAAEEAAIIEREVGYLKESSGRLGRKDWLNVLYG